MSRAWIDISVPLQTGMPVWPGDPPVDIRRFQAIARGDSANVSAVSMSLHTGTHMDPPLHYFDDGSPLDAMPLDAVIGRARVIGIRARRVIEPAEFAPHRVRRGERILLKTRNSALWRTGRFEEDHVRVSPEGARWLAERRIRTLGIDYLSVGGDETHRILLAAGIWIIEGLDLSLVRPGPYEMICLPLKVLQSDGAPARAILWPLAASRSSPAGPRSG